MLLLRNAKVSLARRSEKENNAKLHLVSRYSHQLIKSNAIEFELVRETDILEAKSKLTIENIMFENQRIIADINAKKAVMMRDAELQRAIECKRSHVIEEKIRAERLSKAIVDAEAIKVEADAAFYKKKAEADARLYEQVAKAKATELLFKAQSEGVKQLQNSFHGDNRAIIKYLMLEKGAYKNLAKKNAEAIVGLKPVITVWDNGKSTVSSK